MSGTNAADKLDRVYEAVRKLTDFQPKVGLVLGSGLGDYAKNIQVVYELPYKRTE